MCISVMHKEDENISLFGTETNAASPCFRQCMSRGVGLQHEDSIQGEVTVVSILCPIEVLPWRPNLLYVDL